MKVSFLFRLCFVIFLSTVLFSIGQAQTANRPNYPLKFRFTNSTGVHDTILTRQAFKYFSKSASYPAYVGWVGQPYAVLRSPLSGVGLFTDSSSSYVLGDTVGWAYYKIANTARFDFNYFATNLGSFINDAGSPNLQVISTPKGLLLIANQNIPPLTELTISYKALISMFPGDPSVVRAIQYW
jgi:hypothetical protein